MPGRLPRLTRRGEFLRVAGRGRKAARPGLVLQALPQPGSGELRLGFTATKKIGNAVTRNRAKRRLREAARLTLAAAPPGGPGAAPPNPSGATPPRGGWDLVLIAREGTPVRPFGQLLGDLRGLLRQLGVTPAGAAPTEPVA
jgi:ribonuclease P protein component